MCDGPFYSGKTVVVVGGGRTALTEASHLARLADKVILIHTSEKFHVSDVIRDIVEKTKKISIIHNSVVKEIKGNN